MPTNTQDTTGRPFLALEAAPEPAAAPARASQGRPWVFLPALLSGALLYLCYFPAAQGWLAWLALVPLLALVRTEGRRIYRAAYVGGLAFFVPALQWLRVADYRMYFTWIGLSLYCSLYFPLAIALLRRLDRRTRLPLVLTVPVVWTALEYLRSNFGGGFAWYLLGYSQHDVLPVIQIADLVGVFGVSFLVAAVNALLFEALCGLPRFRRLLALPEVPAPRRLLGPTVAVLGLLAATLGYGFWRLGQTDFAEGPTVALIQSNIDQRIRNEITQNSDEACKSMFQHVGVLTDHACKGGKPLDLIVWPETSYPYDWVEVPANLPADQVPLDLRDRLRANEKNIDLLARQWKSNLLIGVGSRVLEEDGRQHSYNSAALIRPDSRLGGRYDKMHRVPFGEYVPFIDWLPWMKRLAPYDDDYSVEAGKQWTAFDLGPYRFGVIICYEDSDPDLARQYVTGDHRADFLVNMSNDGWFDGSSEHAQHLAICRFRAVECRRSIVRSVNMGISALIDGNGRVRQADQGYLARPNGTGRAWNWKGIPGDSPPRGVELSAAQWSDYIKAKGVLLTSIPIDDRTSVYAFGGNWLPWGCWVLIGGMFVGMVMRRRPG